MDEEKTEILDYHAPAKSKGGLLRPSRYKPFWPIAVAGASIIVAGAVAGGVMWYKAVSAKQSAVWGEMPATNVQWQPADGQNTDDTSRK